MFKEDFTIVYSKHPKGEITLWCDGCAEEEDVGKKMRKKDTGSTKRQEKEADVDDVFTQLKEKHGQKYDIPKLRLWARSICGNLHDDLDTPPDLPPFCKQVPKKARRESLTEALSGAAVTLANVFKGDSVPVQNPKATRCNFCLVKPLLCRNLQIVDAQTCNCNTSNTSC